MHTFIETIINLILSMYHSGVGDWTGLSGRMWVCERVERWLRPVSQLTWRGFRVDLDWQGYQDVDHECPHCHERGCIELYYYVSGS